MVNMYVWCGMNGVPAARGGRCPARDEDGSCAAVEAARCEGLLLASGLWQQLQGSPRVLHLPASRSLQRACYSCILTQCDGKHGNTLQLLTSYMPDRLLTWSSRTPCQMLGQRLDEHSVRRVQRTGLPLFRLFMSGLEVAEELESLPKGDVLCSTHLLDMHQHGCLP